MPYFELKDADEAQKKEIKEFATNFENAKTGAQLVQLLQNIQSFQKQPQNSAIVAMPIAMCCEGKNGKLHKELISAVQKWDNAPTASPNFKKPTPKTDN